MKTNVKLKITHEGREDYCRVKLDSNKFPYVVIDNEKLVINNTQFPRTIKFMGLTEMTIELISGQSELEAILANPELTVDKMSLKQMMRVG
jgi:hypothetical protein